MKSIIDCIKRVPPVLENILKNREVYLAELNIALTEHKIDEIIFIGLGDVEYFGCDIQSVCGKSQWNADDGCDGK